MKKKWGVGKTIIVVVIIFILFVIAAFAFFFLRTPKQPAGGGGGGHMLVNPVSNLDDESAIQQFNESFVYYMLYAMKAYNLHNLPLSSDTPKIKFLIEGEPYSAIVENGRIGVSKGSIPGEDIIIITSKKEAVSMLRSQDNIMASFSSGASEIEMVAGKATLFGKGYLQMYNEITGGK